MAIAAFHLHLSSSRLPVLVLTCISGCAAPPAGSWSLVETEPKGTPFPFHSVTFDKDGGYQAKGFFTPGGEYRTDIQESGGSVSVDRGATRIKPAGGPPLDYTVTRRLDGKLAVTFLPPGEKKRIVALFKPMQTETLPTSIDDARLEPKAKATSAGQDTNAPRN